MEEEVEVVSEVALLELLRE
jgi:hypothetical protein